MASVKVFPRLDKVNSEGKVPVYLRVTKNRKSKHIALDTYIFSKDWSKKSGKVKATATNATQINTYIATKVAEAERITLELETRSTPVTSCDIKHRILGKAPADFFEYVENRKDIMDKEYAIGTIRRYKCVMNKLREFCKGDSLYFDDINVTLIRNFQQHLLSGCNNHVNTVNANLKVIRRLLFDAVTEELLPFEKNPFNKIRLKGQATKQTFLLDDELERLEKLELPSDSQLNHHRNLYIFGAYACGIRISDLLMMRWRNVSGDRLYFQIRKNKESLGIKMPPRAIQILDFYLEIAQKKNCQTELNPDAFIFPFIRIGPGETDRKKIHNAISSATAYTNKDLKKLRVHAGLNKHISFHTARHSWAVRALQKGMRIEYVSRLMGHSSVKNTEIYAKILDCELDKAMEIFN
ncbi:MAG: site-specific integrase [Bacteroidota bacterium]